MQDSSVFQLAKDLDAAAKAILSRGERKKVWLPTRVYGNRFENVTQGLVVSKGPRAGREVTGKVTGQKYWRTGQHIIKRQRSPKDPDEAVIGTKQLFWRTKVDTKALEGEGDLIVGSQLNSSTSGQGAVRVLSWGKWHTVNDGLDSWDEMTAQEMQRLAQAIRRGQATNDEIIAARQLLASVAITNQPPVSREAEIVQGSAVEIEGRN